MARCRLPVAPYRRYTRHPRRYGPASEATCSHAVDGRHTICAARRRMSLVLSWRDNYLTGSRDGESTQRILLGDGGVVDAILCALSDAGIASEWTTHSGWDDQSAWRRRPIRSAAEARRMSRASNGHFSIAGPDTDLHIYLSADRSMKITVRCGPRDRIVERLLRMESRVRRRAPGQLVRSPVLSMRTTPVPRVRPRRVFAFWPSDALVLVVDRPHLEHCVAVELPGRKAGAAGERRYVGQMLAELDVLESARLPTGAGRFRRDDKVVFDFTCIGSSAWERWLCSLGLEARRHSNDNLHGDRVVDWSHMARRAPEGSGVTLYDPFGSTAYVTVIPQGGVVDATRLSILSRARTAGHLATGERVRRVMIVVPSRGEAVALRSLVDDGHVDGVVYQDGLFWDPNVLGESEWLEWPEEHA
jgi:hypothetical protein